MSLTIYQKCKKTRFSYQKVGTRKSSGSADVSCISAKRRKKSGIKQFGCKTALGVSSEKRRIIKNISLAPDLSLHFCLIFENFDKKLRNLIWRKNWSRRLSLFRASPLQRIWYSIISGIRLRKSYGLIFYLIK